MSEKHPIKESFRIAFKGLYHGLFYERNSKIQLIVASIVIVTSIFLQIPKFEFLLIISACFLVIMLELINTSIEKLLDVLYPERHPEIGLVKDIMSGVVLLASILSVFVGISILYDPMKNYLLKLFL